MDQDKAGDGSRQGERKSECETEQKHTDGFSKDDLEATMDSASSTGGSSSKSSKPSSGDVRDISPMDERKTRKRRNDVLYSRNRRQRERNEADTLREHSAMLTRTNEALKREETRLLHLYVDASKTIEELNSNYEGRITNPACGETKISACESSTSERDSTSIVRESTSMTTDQNPLLNHPQPFRHSSRTAANDVSTALASILPQLLQHSNDAPSDNQISQSQALSQLSGSIHPLILQRMLLGNSGTISHLSPSFPPPYVDLSTLLMPELNQRTSNQSDALFVGSSAGQNTMHGQANGQANAIDGTPLASLSDRPLPAQNLTLPGGGAATLLPVTLLPSVTNQNTSVEASLLESLVCSMLSGPGTPHSPQPSTSVENTIPPGGRTGIPSSSTSADVSREGAMGAPQLIPHGGVYGSSDNLRLLLESLIAARNNNIS
jgi:hypothetical protein